jgi:hypothetical protein
MKGDNDALVRFHVHVYTMTAFASIQLKATFFQYSDQFQCFENRQLWHIGFL